MIDIAGMHPAVVHAPLVLLPIATLFVLADLLSPRRTLRLVALVLLIGGVATAILAKETGTAAGEEAHHVDASVEEIRVAEPVPQLVSDGRLLDTHSKLGEWTRNIYGGYLVIEGGLFFLSSAASAHWRRNWSLSPATERIIRWVSLIIAVAAIGLIVLTGHYGGMLVYEYGVGVRR